MRRKRSTRASGSARRDGFGLGVLASRRSGRSRVEGPGAADEWGADMAGRTHAAEGAREGRDASPYEERSRELQARVETGGYSLKDLPNYEPGEKGNVFDFLGGEFWHLRGGKTTTPDYIARLRDARCAIGEREWESAASHIPHRVHGRYWIREAPAGILPHPHASRLGDRRRRFPRAPGGVRYGGRPG